jgi:hypothetical protein
MCLQIIILCLYFLSNQIIASVRIFLAPLATTCSGMGKGGVHIGYPSTLISRELKARGSVCIHVFLAACAILSHKKEVYLCSWLWIVQQKRFVLKQWVIVSLVANYGRWRLDHTLVMLLAACPPSQRIVCHAYYSVLWWTENSGPPCSWSSVTRYITYCDDL